MPCETRPLNFLPHFSIFPKNCILQTSCRCPNNSFLRASNAVSNLSSCSIALLLYKNSPQYKSKLSPAKIQRRLVPLGILSTPTCISPTPSPPHRMRHELRPCRMPVRSSRDVSTILQPSRAKMSKNFSHLLILNPLSPILPIHTQTEDQPTNAHRSAVQPNECGQIMSNSTHQAKSFNNKSLGNSLTERTSTKRVVPATSETGSN